MLPTRTRKAQGFTLVEILIVVVILGILAAIVIPQFTSASEQAKASSLVSQLQTIRSQLELYQIQHNGNYPTIAQLNLAANPWGVMVDRTDENGTIGTTDGTHDFGPYLQKAPVNPFADTAETDVSDISAADTYADTGWGYNASTGEIKAMIRSEVDSTTLGLTDTNDFVLE
ncbi:MAG: prepilin-type N-terminal cleavage/methylation domain-containing protein [Planctomycetota bacterium]